MYDPNRIKKWMRWTKKRFKDKTIAQVWNKIQENPKLLEEYNNFEKYKRHSEASTYVEFAVRTHGWSAFLDAIWILASRKEEILALSNNVKEEQKWTKVKDKLSQIPRNAQT